MLKVCSDPVEKRLTIQDNIYKPWGKKKKVTGRDYNEGSYNEDTKEDCFIQ